LNQLTENPMSKLSIIVLAIVAFVLPLQISAQADAASSRKQSRTAEPSCVVTADGEDGKDNEVGAKAGNGGKGGTVVIEGGMKPNGCISVRGGNGGNNNKGPNSGNGGNGGTSTIKF
jgi:hypothetical protein